MTIRRVVLVAAVTATAITLSAARQADAPANRCSLQDAECFTAVVCENMLGCMGGTQKCAVVEGLETDNPYCFQESRGPGAAL